MSSAGSVERQRARMHIYVPTRGRVDRQFTLKHMTDEWRKRITLVCPSDEARQHAKNWPMVQVVSQPDRKMTIAAKRKWIFEKTKHEKIIMMDDDLRFGYRLATLDHFRKFGHLPQGADAKASWAARVKKWPQLGLLEKVHCKPQLTHMLNRVEWMLNIYSHGGIGARLMNHVFPYEFTMNMRAMYAIAFHVPTVLEHCKLGRIEHREDLDYTLQLMAAGFENALYTWGSVEQQRGFNAEGGAHEERTMRAANIDAVKLAKLHPDVVTYAKRPYKVSTPRVEVRVSWKKAAQLGKAGVL